MKVGVIIPTRGNRPEFLANCLRMMRNQTLRPTVISLVDDPPKSDKCDITWRYRTGYDRLRNQGLDVIAFIEDDDYYHPEYLERMVHWWRGANKPELFGIRYTIYYHLVLKKYFNFPHDQRASAMSTLIKPDMNLNWTVDHDPYTDQWLWMPNTNIGITDRKTIHPVDVPCIGIKHGFTMTGGKNHIDRLHRYTQADPEMLWLYNNTDPESYLFYKKMSDAGRVLEALAPSEDYSE